MAVQGKNVKDNNISVFYSSAEIARRVTVIAAEIAGYIKSNEIKNEDFVLISLLKGSFVFTADLVRALYNHDVHPTIDFMAVHSYGNDTKSSGEVVMDSDFRENIKGKFVLLVDDILESGRTLSFVSDIMKERGAKQIKIAVFLEKPGKNVKKIKADFVGFMVPDKFVVGYGLDHAGNYRELPYVALVENKS